MHAYAYTRVIQRWSVAPMWESICHQCDMVMVAEDYTHIDVAHVWIWMGSHVGEYNGTSKAKRQDTRS